jgi:exopolyphosphatase/guanosine-5'-triphosphate,3'-diphosphate pyrophosphatase
MRFAAVDIGSNAVRLLFCQVSSDRNGLVIKKISLVRLPIRLGEDVFVKGSISEENISKLSKALQAFKLLSDVYDIVDYRVCATSAMREAENSIAVVERIKKETAVKIEVVKGEEEAQLIFDTNLTEKLDQNKTYMYIDVGGGSTEITIFLNQKKLASKSFKIGTIRLKNKLVSNTLWDDMTAWMKDSKEKFNPEIAIGTGGNINTLYKLCRLDNNAILKYKQLKKISQTLKKYSIEERMERFELRPDRADVITQASNIYIEAMKTFEIKRMIVPKIGVADGIIYQLWKKSRL